MNKKIILIIITPFLLRNHEINGMEAQKHSNYCPEKVNEEMKQSLRKIIATKFKHALLNHNFQERTDRNNWNALHTISLGLQKEKTFSHHDGTYSIVPDIGHNYIMWDESPTNKTRASFYIGEDDREGNYTKLLHGTLQGKPDFAVCIPDEQSPNNQTEIVIAVPSTKQVQHLTCTLDLKLSHSVLSNDHQWCVWALQDKSKSSIDLFNLDSRTAPYSFNFKHPISALCAAHKSTLFAVCTAKGHLGFITPCPTIPTCADDTIDIHTHAQFSPDDHCLITYGGNILRFYLLNQPPNPTEYVLVKTDRPIRKAIFSPDGKLIIIAMANGEFLFCDGTTGKVLEYYPATWRIRSLSSIDDQAPLLLCSAKNNLLISLDPACHTNTKIYTFVVRKLTNGRVLTAYNFPGNNPKAMGLTEDEQSVVFTHNDNTVSLLPLYNKQDCKDTKFIERKANLYQLFEMFQVCQQYKSQQTKNINNLNATALVSAIRSYIGRNKI